MAVKALLHVMPWLKFQVSLSGIEFRSEELHPARGALLCHGEKQQTFCWCRWDELIGCKKLDASCSHLWFSDQAC